METGIERAESVGGDTSGIQSEKGSSILTSALRIVHPLFQEEGGGSIPTSPLQLHFGVISLQRAKQLNDEWHSRLPRYSQTQSIICYGAEFAGRFYAVAIWSNPSSASLPSTWLELKRMAISEDSPKNTASRMLGWMVRDIRKRLPSIPKLISYQDTEVHAGTIYKASGWIAAHTSRGDTWQGRKNRPRSVEQTTSPKIRWELAL